MIVESYRCEFCQKTVPNRYAAQGWIFFERPTNLRISKGVDDGKFQTHYMEHITDFCSAQCLSKYADLDLKKDPLAK